MNEVRQKPDLTRTSMCKTQTEVGTCTDPHCRFAHNEAQLRATHGFFKMKMCGFAQSGRCKHGDSCRFAHSREELRPAKPLPAGVEADPRLAGRQPQQMQQDGRQPQSQSGGRGRGTTSVQGNNPPRGQGVANQDFNMNNFIFGKRGDTDVPPPPEQFNEGSEVNDTEQQGQRRQQRRPQRRQTNQPLRNGPVPQSKGENENDSADGSSWGGSGSSATELPRSEHTGSPGTSDCSSNNVLQATGATSSSWETPPPNSIGEQRSKAKTQKPPKEKEAKITTLLVINVPTYLTQGALLSMLEDLTQSMRGNYDFYYCPWDERRGHNMGYAILNFPDPNHALDFQQHWTNRLICRGSRGQRPLRVLRASVQGYQANLEYFSKVEIAACSDLRFRPLYRDANSMMQPLPLQMSPKPGEPLLEPPPTFLAEMGLDVVGQDGLQGGMIDFALGQQSNTTAQDFPSGRSAAQSDSNMRRAVGTNGGWNSQRAPKRQGQNRLDMQQQFHTTAAPAAASSSSAAEPGTSSRLPHGEGGTLTGDNFMRSTGFGALFSTGSGGKEEYWMAPGPDTAAAAAERDATASGNCAQQVLTWPMMMTAVSWPPGPLMETRGQRAGMSTEEGACHDSSAQDQYAVEGSNRVTPRTGQQPCDYSTAGDPAQAQQVLYHQHMAPYMMTVMEPMMPVGGNNRQMDQSMISQPGSMMQMMPNMWVTDEVYMD